MIEKQTIKGRDVWISVDPVPMHRENPATIPTEYFTATYYFEEPPHHQKEGETVKDGEEPRLFESPVAALSHVQKLLENQ